MYIVNFGVGLMSNYKEGVGKSFAMYVVSFQRVVQSIFDFSCWLMLAVLCYTRRKNFSFQI